MRKKAGLYVQEKRSFSPDGAILRENEHSSQREHDIQLLRARATSMKSSYIEAIPQVKTLYWDGRPVARVAKEVNERTLESPARFNSSHHAFPAAAADCVMELYDSQGEFIHHKSSILFVEFFQHPWLIWRCSRLIRIWHALQQIGWRAILWSFISISLFLCKG